jgi:hypothetical protein
MALKNTKANVLNNLNKNNIDEIASKITTDKTKIEQVKQIKDTA